MSKHPNFPEFFRALWDKEPFPWQAMLAERVTARPWPDAIDLPTAAGKTVCLDIAVWALAVQAHEPLGRRSAPRRIWFVVDRRIVVDEAFERARWLADKLAQALSACDPASPIYAVAERLLKLRGLPSRQRPLAVARLRGGTLLDDSWARVPSQPAIICSTADQIGSALLFRPYRHGILSAPVYAGLAANDSLILLDEAHCAVPFLQTLRAVRRFRGDRWSEQPNPTPFQVAVLSATPPTAVDDEPTEIFPTASERDLALDHPVLHARLKTSKPATLELVPDEEALAQRLAEAAADFVRHGKRRVGVIVNRVGRAQQVVQKLEQLATPAESAERYFDVHLLTGRIRPFERDLLIAPGKDLHRWFRANQPEEPPRPQILVATQCLEVGADFSFDALVTECASLDALRQRFGRLARLGLDQGQDAPAIILTAKSCLQESGEDRDPVYGQALKNTWDFLDRIATPIEPAPTDQPATGKRRRKSAQAPQRRIVDFGVKALDRQLPSGDELLKRLAPTSDAPVLLPAHLDLLCQTAPAPHPEPDLTPFLHGKGRGQPEVNVVWRCDLDPRRAEDWPEIVSLTRPVAGEMLPVPLFRLRQWLRDHTSADSTGDVEGSAPEADTAAGGGSATPFLLWRGRDRSEVLTDPARIPPGAVVVLPVPAEPADAEALGQALREQGFGTERLDFWELAWRAAGRPPALRVQRAVLARWLPACPPLADLLALAERDDWTIAELRDALAAVRDWTPQDGASSPLDPWLRDLFAAVAQVRKRDVAVHPGGGLVLRAPAAAPEEEPDLFADQDDAWSEASEEILLADHTAQVEDTVAVLAQSCLDTNAASLLQTAARWHDTGKLDPRFQAFLRAGLPDFDQPRAKSPDLPRSSQAARRLREAAGLPENFRHEMLSLQLAERSAPSGLTPEDRELFLHLIASHHGYARPFAPVCEDPEPPAVEGQLGNTPVSLNADHRRTLTAPHRLDSGVSDRFWRLVRRFGWWGLAYREALLRLADWYASRHPRPNTTTQQQS